MGVAWTDDQLKVINLRDRNILVSAAAGSGKTAVLVERIIKMVTDRERPMDIDRLLVVTFTNAAAAEMRERIGDAVERALKEQPQNEHLQRQLTLIHNAQITTIDSFCLYIIRNHFHEIDLEPNFRIGDEGELKLLKEDVLSRVLSRNYEEMTPQFKRLADGYAPGRSDEALAGMVLQLYEFSRSYPWPKEWLAAAAKDYELSGEEDLDRAVWMRPVTEEIRTLTKDFAALTKRALALAEESDGPGMYQKALESDRKQYSAIAECQSFTEFYAAYQSLTYERLAAARGYEGSREKQELVKTLRETAKDAVKKLKKQYFFAPPAVMAEQLRKTAPMARELVRLTLEFADAFAEEKRRKNLVDFHDLEHFALEILVDEETGAVKKTAEEFQEHFTEIMIDEYQDSNQVQETILRAVSREGRGVRNIFMVGDVKQSIYRFRLARPELFMEKYDTYSLTDSDTQRIDLHKNFRSRPEVLDFVNAVFRKIMRRSLGNVEYDDDAALYPGASYPVPGSLPEDAGDGMFAPEILLVDADDALLADEGQQDKKLLEARLIAAKIAELKQEQLVTDKQTGELRPLRYSDIVILLRSLSGYADSFAAALCDAGVPAHTVSATGYFSTVEVQTVLSMLRILDNPRQDIPLTAVLRSPIAGLTDEELALLRIRDKNAEFHVCVLRECERLLAREHLTSEKEETRSPMEEKLYAFYRTYLKLRALVPDTPIHELIELLLKETGYGDYAAAMPAGARRRANLLMLVEKAIAYENTSYKGLFHFVRYIDELQKYDVDFGEADLLGENEDVVRIMSIHKSKGLEFPVVFAAGLGKQFNRQDTRSRMVLHPELGIGLDYMDGERRTKSVTMAKRAIAGQIDAENLGEELRVLYVALTRAKEKLILTGTVKKAEETINAMRASAGEELSYLARESASGYLDWILPAVFSCGQDSLVRLVPAAELVLGEIREQVQEKWDYVSCMEEIGRADEAKKQEFAHRFSEGYAHPEDITRKNKYSVSELKHRAMRERMQREEEEVTPVFPEDEIIPYIPAFAREMEHGTKEVNQGALRGTAVHRVMECYRFSSEAGVSEQIERMLCEEKLTPEMKELVRIAPVERFVESDVGKRMKRAEECGKLYREKPFVMGFTAEELAAFGFAENPGGPKELRTDAADGDLTLIQGIIDVFWIEDDGIVILDYKTDRVETPQELLERYEAQLCLYAEALERLYRGQGLRVREKLLYSFRLGMTIPVEAPLLRK